MKVNIPTKTLKNGFSMPIFGLGTWQMGGRLERNFENDDKADIKAIQNAIENGITHIDTAQMYANGYSEILVSKAISGYKREDLFLVSKVSSTNLDYKNVINSAKNSLKRLNTSYLDLYLIHGPNPEIPIKKTMEALDFLKSEGLIRNIGVSNFSKERLIEAQKCTENKIVTDQVHYNLKFREPQKTGLLEYCQKNDVMLVAYRPFQKGILLEDKNSLLDEICQKYNKTPAQIGINWLISQENVVTLSKMRNESHLMENLDALNWQLEKEDIKKLDKLYPDQQDISDVCPLI
jgi:diketogulonate reductase-like aldo/keto reductase